jgi:hypothetical protein
MTPDKSQYNLYIRPDSRLHLSPFRCLIKSLRLHFKPASKRERGVNYQVFRPSMPSESQFRVPFPRISNERDKSTSLKREAQGRRLGSCLSLTANDLGRPDWARQLAFPASRRRGV